MAALGTLALLAVPFRAHAQLSLAAQAHVQYESDSNVFDLSSKYPQLYPTSDQRGDRFVAYGAQFNLDYLLGQQQFFFIASGTRFEYDHYTQLDYEGYRLEGGWNWSLTSRLNGKLDVTRTRTLVPFYDLPGTVAIGTMEMSLQTLQKEEASGTFALAPRWAVDGDLFGSELREPLPQSPDLQLNETYGRVAVRYLGTARFNSGVYVAYDQGRYEGVTSFANPDYYEVDGGIVTNYQSPRTKYSGQIGYSRRLSAATTDATDGVTGSLSVREQLTPKTSVTVTAGRSISNYLATTGSEIDTSTGVSASWDATYKLAVTVGYTYVYRDYPHQGNNPVGSQRVDIQDAATLNIDYHPRPWISIAPYATQQWRISTFIGGDFKATTFGVNVTVTRPGK